MMLRMSRRLLQMVPLLVAVATPGLADESPGGALAEPGRLRPLAIELDRPAPEQHIREPGPRTEVSGRAGSLPFFESDVVILIDNSTLAATASGIDVDEDGKVGRNRSSVTHREPLAPDVPLWTTDSGDTIQQMQLRIARALVARLADRQNRVGLASINFRSRSRGAGVVRLTERPRVSVPVGDPDAVLAALADFPAAQERRWTDLTRLLEVGAELLDAATPEGEPSRSRAILLLSLGPPSAPVDVGWSSKQAVESAGGLADLGIALWAVPLRSADTPFLSELSHGGGGNLLRLDQLDEQFSAPVPSDLRPRELEVENVTSHTQATNPRVFPDGRFDAEVPLVPGANTLEVRAVLADGQRATVRRVVYYEAPPHEQAP